MKTRLLVWLVCALAFPTGVRGAAERRFDFGPPGSPVAKGFAGISSADVFSVEKGYGWTSGSPADYTAPKPAQNRTRWWHLDPWYFFDDITNELRCDGVESAGPLAFKVMAPKGLWRVVVTLGHLLEPRYSIDIYANGKLAARKVDARHRLSSERGRLLNSSGYYRRVRFTVDVRDEGLEIAFKGDDTEFQRLLAEAKASDPATWPKSRFRGDSLPPEHLPFLDIGGPYSKIGLMGLEIFPDADPPIRLDPGSLKLSASGVAAKDAAPAKAVAAFNAGRFPQADAAFSGLADPVAKGMGLLALAGRPEYEKELDNATRAVAALRQAMASGKGSPRIREILESAEVFLNGLTLFKNRGVPPNNGPRTTWRAINELDQTQPDDLFYWKSQIAQARYMRMTDPHQWAWQGQEALRKLAAAEKKFPDNRFVRYHLHGEWTPQPPDWVFPDYSPRAQGAPAWAASVYEAFNRELDLAEWWFKNRQAADGSMGGGWGDDVELLRGFGSVGAICPDASRSILAGVRKVANGAWVCDEMDPEAGYFAQVADSEHSGEFTADPLTAMTLLDYGNPLYLERSLKTGKLMRDLWMGVNQKGQFLMRSNFLGARGVGGKGTQNDSRINYRPAAPARAVHWYSRLPTIEKLFVRWADAWLAASMSTEKGKPRGIVPEEIGFATGELGGENAPSWHTADHPKGSVNSDWGGLAGYHTYVVDLFVLAWRATGDEKYLEPMRLEAEYVETHLPKELRGINNLALLREKAKALHKGSPEWIASSLAGWPEQWAEMRNSLLGEKTAPKGDLVTLAEAARKTNEEREGARKYWPLETTDALATDRIHWPGLWSALQVMSGFGLQGRLEPLVTYRGLGRDFAAVVTRVDSAGARVVLYSLSREAKRAALLVWPFELGTEYRFRIGPDGDGDGRMDHVSAEASILMENRDQGFPFDLPPRSQFVVEIERTGDKRRPDLRPDLAISEEDLRRLPAGGLEVLVHNIGSVEASNVIVRLSAGGRTLAERVIPRIEAPLDLEPKMVRVVFDRAPRGLETTGQLTVALDPGNAIREVAETNNRIPVPRSAAPAAR